jgi:hypothetical protein
MLSMVTPCLSDDKTSTLGIEIKLKTYDGIADHVEHVEHINAVLQLSVQINSYYVGFYPILNCSSKTESNI